MRKMKKNKFYRICAGLLTALLVFTSIPQTFSSAEEDDIRLAEELEAGLYVETPEEETGEEFEEEEVIEDIPEEKTPEEEILEEDRPEEEVLPEDDIPQGETVITPVEPAAEMVVTDNANYALALPQPEAMYNVSMEASLLSDAAAPRAAVTDITIKQDGGRVESLSLTKWEKVDLTAEVDSADFAGTIQWESADSDTINVQTEENGKTCSLTANKVTETGTPVKVTVRVSADENESKPDSNELEITVNPAVLTEVVSIGADPVEVQNGTALDDIMSQLPTETKIKVENDSEAEGHSAAITWSNTTDPAYDPASEAEQNIKISGTVTLPDGVDNPGDKLSLTVEKQVLVKAKETDPAPEKSITLSPGNLEFTLGDAPKKLTATVVPEGETVTWVSSDETVATVENGTVTAKKVGTCTITARLDEDHTAVCQVTVKEAEKPEECSLVVASDSLSYATNQAISKEMIFQDLDLKLKIGDAEPIPIEFGESYLDMQLSWPGSDGLLNVVYKNGDWTDALAEAGEKELLISYYSGGVAYEKTVTITVTQKRGTLKGISSLLPVNEVPNGTSLAVIMADYLDGTARIFVTYEDGEEEWIDDIPIRWNGVASGENYSPSKTDAAQNFTVVGEVVLPNYITGDSTMVTQRVQVREALTSGSQVASVTASIPTESRVPYGTKLALSCETEGAEIHYTTDGSNATVDSKVYSEEIILTKDTHVVDVVATKSGWKNSERGRFFYIVEDPVEPVVPDPDDPEPEDQITDADRPTDGKVPDGLWVAIQTEDESEKDGFAYTGKAIKPAVHVYDRVTLLKEKKDYTISYKNNVNAGAKGSAKSPVIVVTGKGNYHGRLEVGFTIKPQSIASEAVLMDEYVAVTHTGKAQKPVVSLSWNGKKLSKKRDFIYEETSYTNPGKYTIQVTGVGNYTGERTMTYEIADVGVLVSRLTVSKIPDQKCTGKPIAPEIQVKYKQVTLTEGRNYTVQYVNNVNVGTASVVITGLNNYKGSRRIDFKIKPSAKISDAGIAMTFDPATPVYMGQPVKPRSYTVVYQAEELKEGVDYRVSYKNNDKAGTANIIFTGIGRFTGTAKRNFKIQAGDITKVTVEDLLPGYPYQVGGATPKPTVMLGERTLVEGQDYTLSYKNNNKIGNTASVVIKGKGSYKGNLERNFAVTMQDIGNLQVSAADKAYQEKANIYKTKVQVIDVNGKPLKAGSDYDRDIVYTYASGPKQGTPVLQTDIVPVGTVIQVEVHVSKPKNYQGTAYGSYRIVQGDISKAKVSIDTQAYTGRKIKPGKNQIRITLNNVSLGNNDYEIIGYENNVNQGTGKVKIRGIGNYGGVKTVNFKIQMRVLQ